MAIGFGLAGYESSVAAAILSSIVALPRESQLVNREILGHIQHQFTTVTSIAYTALFRNFFLVCFGTNFVFGSGFSFSIASFLPYKFA